MKSVKKFDLKAGRILGLLLQLLSNCLDDLEEDSHLVPCILQ